MECSRRRSPAACRSRLGSPSRGCCGRPGGSRASALAEAKRDATVLALKEQEDAGIDIVTDGEQARQHFVHGFLEQIDGIDFGRRVTMGIRNNRYNARSADRHRAAPPQAERSPLRGRNRPRPYAATAQIHPAWADDHRRHDRRRALRRQDRSGHGVCRATERGGARTGGDRRRCDPVRRARLQRLHGRGDENGGSRRCIAPPRGSAARPPCTSATATASRQISIGKRASARNGANTRRSSRPLPASRIDQVSVECAGAKVPIELLGLAAGQGRSARSDRCGQRAHRDAGGGRRDDRAGVALSCPRSASIPAPIAAWRRWITRSQ